MIEFDEDKRQANLIKHGCDFIMAEAFQWETAIGTEDDRYDYGEIRIGAIGLIGSILYYLVFTERGNNLRVMLCVKPTGKKDRPMKKQIRKKPLRKKPPADWDDARRCPGSMLQLVCATREVCALAKRLQPAWPPLAG